MSQQFAISYTSIFRILIVLLSLLFVYFIRDIIVILFLSIILAAAFDPMVSWFERRQLPRSFGVLTIYVLLFTVISVIGILLMPVISAQGNFLANNLPLLFRRLVDQVGGSGMGGVFSQSDQLIQDVSQTFGTVFKGVFPALRGVFGGTVTLLLTLVLTFYLSVEDRGLKRFFRSILPDQYQPYFTRMMNRVQKKMGMWFRGQMLLSLVIFIVTAVSLLITHLITGAIPYWLLLALIAGILESVPFIGPLIAGAISVLLVSSNSLTIAAIVLGISIIIQQLENHILVPKIMQKTVGLNPIVVILVVIIGYRLSGVIGALIAIPVAAAVQVFLKDVMRKEETAPIPQ